MRTVCEKCDGKCGFGLVTAMGTMAETEFCQARYEYVIALGRFLRSIARGLQAETMAIAA